MAEDEALRVGVDIGGSGIKAAAVDLGTGELLADRIRVETPASFGFDEIVAAAATLVRGIGDPATVGVGFPGVVAHGIVKSPPTAHEHEGWVGKDLARALTDQIGAPTTVLNDADAAGQAEVMFGAGRGVAGLVMIFTLGTGVGSAVFIDGVLVPNTELGKLFLADESEVAEHQIADRIRSDEDLGWSEWGDRLHRYFAHVDRLFTPDLIVVGGGVSKKHGKFLDRIDVRAEVAPAVLRNQAGIVGAALAAAPA